MEKNNTTQPQIAEAVGVSRQAVGQWQNGNTVPDILDFQKVADYYNVSADYLLGRSESQSNDKDLKDVADYLNVSDKAVDIIRICTNEEEKRHVFIMPIEYTPIENSNVTDWCIRNLLLQVKWSLMDMLYALKNEIQNGDSSSKKYEKDKMFSEKVHMKVYKLSDFIKQKIDRFMLDVTKAACEKKQSDLHYTSIYNQFEGYGFYYPKDEKKKAGD